MKQPKPGQDVIVRWIDSGLTQSGDPSDPRKGILAVCETHGRVVSCKKDPALKALRGIDTTTLRLATNHYATPPKDDEVDLFSIWWPAVVSIRTWKS